MPENEIEKFKEYLFGFAEMVYGTIKQDREVIDSFVKAQAELLSVIASIVEEYGDEREIYIHPDTVEEVEDKYYKLTTKRDEAGGIRYTVEFMEEKPDAEQDSREDIQA